MATVSRAARAVEAGESFLLDASGEPEARLLADRGLGQLGFWDQATLAERLRLALLDRGLPEVCAGAGADALSVWRERAEARAWLEALREEETLLQQRAARMEAVARAEARQREHAARRREAAARELERRQLEQLERAIERARVADREADRLREHILAIERSAAWAAARRLQRLAGIRDALAGRSRHTTPAHTPPHASPSPSAIRPGTADPFLPTAIRVPGDSAASAESAAAARALPAPAVADPSVAVPVVRAGAPLPPARSDDGDLVAILDVGAWLEPAGLAAAVRAAERDGLDAVLTGEREVGRCVRPGLAWSPTAARSWAQASGLVVLRRAALARLGGLREDAGTEALHELLLRAGDRARIGAVAEPGCARVGPGGPQLERPGLHRALAAGLGQGERLEEIPGLAGARRPRRRLAPTRVSIVMPTRDRPDLLAEALAGLARTSWRPLEVVLVDNGSVEPRALRILDRTAHRVIRAPGTFNYSRLVNRGCASASGEVLVLLNNDVEVRDPTWVEALVEQALRPGVGPVGALLRHPDGSIQHCGIVIRNGVPVHALAGRRMSAVPAACVRVPGERIAVTGACLAIRREVLARLGGLEPLLARNYNDVDLCLRAAGLGLATVYTPFADLVHRESSTRGHNSDPEVSADWLMFRTRWREVLARPDPWWPDGVLPEGAEL